MFIKKNILFFIGLMISANIWGQQLLSIQEAIDIALVNNHDIHIKKKEVEISAKQIDPSLVGRKPVINLNASYEFGWSDAATETLSLAPGGEGNNNIDLDGISNDFVIGPEISMVLLDGKAGVYRLDQLSALNGIAQLQLQQSIEQTLVAVTGSYLEMARQQSLIGITQESIQLIQERLLRAQQDAKYGTSSSLQALQIEVDLKTDSANLRSLNLGYENAKRNLNRLLGRPTDTDFRVDPDIPLNTQLILGELENALKQNNTSLKLGDNNVNLAAIEVKLSEAAFKPTLQGYANLNYVNLRDDANFLQANRVIGPNVGVRFQYPLFDGGARKIRQQVAQMTQEKRQLERSNIEQELLKELRNGFAVYKNTQAQLRIENSNLKAYETNFQNMQNMYRLGTATNTDVRAAQLNLNGAKNRINNYQYIIKQAEISLYLLSGQLIQ